MPLLWIQINKIGNHPRLLSFFILFLITFSLMLPCFLLKIKHFFVPSLAFSSETKLGRYISIHPFSPLSGSFAARPTGLSF